MPVMHTVSALSIEELSRDCNAFITTTLTPANKPIEIRVFACNNHPAKIIFIATITYNDDAA